MGVLRVRLTNGTEDVFTEQFWDESGYDESWGHWTTHHSEIYDFTESNGDLTITKLRAHQSGLAEWRTDSEERVAFYRSSQWTTVRKD